MNERAEHEARVEAYARPDVRRVVCVGIPVYKHRYVPRFCAARDTEVVFVREPRAASELREGDAVLVWGSRRRPVDDLAARRGVPLWRMEDGFLRSVGLGSDLNDPISLVVDTTGIYYDPSAPSDLERLLASHDFDEAELSRAAALRRQIVAYGISKYNVGSRRRVGPTTRARTRVLAIGQVEDDASIQRGTVDIRTNEALLRAARLARPRAHLIYKPHPDVVRGHRRDSLPLTLARRLADEVVVDASLADCLAAADEVHTMTSLVGFEALMRELPVVTYGQPFYAGWGLTEDRHPHPRRTRRLPLDALVAGTLIRYARYVHPQTGRYTTPEAIVEHLRARPRGAPLRRLGPLRRPLERLRNILDGALRRG